MPTLAQSSVKEDNFLLYFWREGIPKDNNTTFLPSEGTETTNSMLESDEETGINNNIAPIKIIWEDIKMQE